MMSFWCFIVKKHNNPSIQTIEEFPEMYDLLDWLYHNTIWYSNHSQYFMESWPTQGTSRIFCVVVLMW